MPRNNLYRVVDDIVAGKKAFPTGVTVSHRVYAEGGDYYFIELPKATTAITDVYNLEEHHISVHDVSKGTLDLVSQYHYTADLVNVTGAKYRLHVYFNPNDRSVGPPLLLLVTPGGDGFKPVDSEEERQAFELLARISTRQVVDFLRKEQEKIVQNLRKKYDRMEGMAVSLSKNLGKNKSSYLEVISHQLVTLTELSCRENFNQNTLGTIKYLTMVKEILQQPPSSLTTTTSTIKAKTPDTKGKERRSIDHKHEQLKFFKKQEKPVFSQRKTCVLTNRKTGLTPILGIFTRELTQIKQLTGDKLTDSLIDFFNRLLEVDLEVGIGNYDGVLVTDLHDLRLLRAATEVLAKTTIEDLLQKKLYTDVARLSSFNYLLPEEMTPNFLLTNDPELVKFVLENKMMAVDYGPFTIHGEHYPSVVDFYFRQSGDPLTKNCFSLCVQYGLPLMQLDERTGLPFAAIPLLYPTHPFSSVLAKHANNSIFYKQLNHALRVLALQPDCPTARKEQIEELIADNQVKIKLLDSNVSRRFTSPALEASVTPLIHAVENTLGGMIISQLRKDPEIIALNRLVERLGAKVLPQLSRVEQKRVSLWMKNKLVEATEGLNAVKDLNLIPSYEVIKANTIACLLLARDGMKLRLDLIAVQSEMGRKRSNHRGKPTKEQRRLLRQQGEIVRQLDECSKQFSAQSIANGTDGDEAERMEAILAGASQSLETLGRDMDQMKHVMEGFFTLFSAIAKITPSALPKRRSVEKKPIQADLAQQFLLKFLVQAARAKSLGCQFYLAGVTHGVFHSARVLSTTAGLPRAVTHHLSTFFTVEDGRILTRVNRAAKSEASNTHASPVIKGT